MPPVAKEVLRHVVVCLCFGLAWAAMQFANGQIRDTASLAGPILVFGLAGLLTWILRRAFSAFRRR